jgi:hypothetical protein
VFSDVPLSYVQFVVGAAQVPPAAPEAFAVQISWASQMSPPSHTHWEREAVPVVQSARVTFTHPFVPSLVSLLQRLPTAHVALVEPLHKQAATVMSTSLAHFGFSGHAVGLVESQ